MTQCGRPATAGFGLLMVVLLPQLTKGCTFTGHCYRPDVVCRAPLRDKPAVEPGAPCSRLRCTSHPGRQAGACPTRPFFGQDDSYQQRSSSRNCTLKSTAGQASSGTRRLLCWCNLMLRLGFSHSPTDEYQDKRNHRIDNFECQKSFKLKRVTKCLK